MEILATLFKIVGSILIVSSTLFLSGLILGLGGIVFSEIWK